MKKLLLSLFTIFATVLAPISVHAAANYDKQASVNDTTLYDPRDYGSLCPAGGTGGTSGPLTGNDNAERIFNFLTGKGLTAAQAAGILGNFQQESGFDPAVIENGAIAPSNYIPVDGVGFGIAQWTWTARQVPLENLAQSSNRKIIDLSLQLDFLWSELTGTFAPALTSLKAETTPEMAAFVFHRDYEISNDTLAAVLQTRGGNAKALYDKYKSLAPGTPSTTAPGGIGCLPGGSSSGGLSNFMGNNFTIYNQCPYPPFGGSWGTLLTPYGANMCSSACVPTALAMVAINMTGAKITPLETINYYTAQGYWYPGGGSVTSSLGSAAGNFGLNATQITDKGNLAAYQAVFAKGGLIIVAAVGTSPFLGTGHAIVLRGITPTGNFLIADPGYRETNIPPANEFSVDKILTDIRSDPNSAVYAYYKK